MNEKKLNYFLAGSRIKYLRELANISQQDLADKLGVSRQTLVGWESKTEVKLKSEIANVMSKALRSSLDDLTNVSHGTNSHDITRQTEEPTLTYSGSSIEALVRTLEKAVDALANDNKAMITENGKLIDIIANLTVNRSIT